MVSFPRQLIACATVLAIATPSAGFAFRALNRLDVEPVNQTTFEVLQRVGAGPTDFWCAAGDYAIRALGTKSNQQVYLVRGKQKATTRNRGNAVTFSIVAPPEAANFTSKPLTLKLTAIGDSLRAAAAQQYCYEGRDGHRLFP